MSSRVYYNQKDIIDEIQIRTGFSNYHIDKVLNTLSDVLKERLSDTHDIVEIKPFTGLKLMSKHSTSKQISNFLCVSKEIPSFIHNVLPIGKYGLRISSGYVRVKYSLL